MSRPLKHTVDYFSHDADASVGKTLTILENYFGHEGYSAWFKLLENISVAHNHIIDVHNPVDLEFLCGKMKFKPEKLVEIFNKMAELEAIDSKLWIAKIIWCENFVARLSSVYEKRKQELPRKPSLDNKTVVSDDNPVTDTDNPITDTDNLIKVTESTQSKLEYIKVNKIIKGNKNLTFEKYCESTLKPLFPNLDIKVQLDKFNTYWSESDKKVTRPKSAFRNWCERAEKYRLADTKNNGHKQEKVSNTMADLERADEERKKSKEAQK
jgi:hypothetical protein